MKKRDWKNLDKCCGAAAFIKGASSGKIKIDLAPVYCH
jgi:hypothetical protein